ncbi:MFS transporter [Phenylobacterium montanum]|uniref:MFS transporter n=1 Tax=Phenylobacterium montanum TaxID=2823693 RepID=A0A975IWN3_9CAUL|nr:MFS transporter [Caulobacter sp. S6]QUD90063.1 MFS transporter [Caulobacter sp. S6]
MHARQPLAPSSPGFATTLAYGSGAIATGVAYAGLSGAVLQYYLNQVLRVPAYIVGLAIMVSLIVDAVVDPLVGQWSDNVRSRWGRRHPFLYASAPLGALAFYFLWNAPQGLAGPALVAFTLALLVVVRIAGSLYDIPSNALAPELAPDYDARTTLVAFRFLFLVIGGVVMTVILNAVLLRNDATHPLGLLNRHGYEQFGLIGGLGIGAAILVSSLGTHGRIRHLHLPPVRKPTLAQTFGEIRQTLTNPSLLALMISGLLSGISGGMMQGLNNYFYTHLWGLSPGQIAFLVVVTYVGSFLSVILAPILSKRFGKKPAMITTFSVYLVAALTPMTRKLMGLMPANGSPWLMPILILDAVIAGTLVILGFVIVSSMVADVVEDVAVKTGQRSEGLLFATNGLLSKFTTGIGAFLAGMMVTAVHFPAHAAQGTVPESLMRHLALLYLPAHAILTAASIAVLVFYRIDRATHEHNLSQLREAALLAEEVVEHRAEAGV